MDTKEKVIALFSYIRELCSMKYKVVTDISSQPWYCYIKDIPNDTDNITMYTRDRVDEDASDEDILLEIKKPEFQNCPKPPKSIENWLASGWDKYSNDAEYKDTITISHHNQIDTDIESPGSEEKIQHFEDSEVRVTTYNNWINIRKEWVEKQKSIAQIRSFFTRLYQIYIDLERESETLELVVANGVIRDLKNAKINHPILMQRVKLSFDAKNNIICIHDTETEPELYTMLLQEIEDIDHSAVKQLKMDLHENFYHPLDRNDTPDYLESLIHRLCPQSKFVLQDEQVTISSDDRLLLTINPVFILRKRIDGTLKAIESIINAINESGKIPGPIIDLVSAGTIEAPAESAKPTIDQQLAASGGESAEILLSKEANREQLEIAQRIENFNAVLVQGPPGTGKTHTIANLLGHFLAQGKSVLVTSHTKKALSVLKDKVPIGIQNLCVSVLDDSNMDMERSIDGITEYLSKYTSHELKMKIDSATNQREDIMQKLAEVRKRIYTIKFKEFQPIVYEGKGYSPANAAAFVNENSEDLSYIPGKVQLNHSLPITLEELSSLYQSNEEISVDDESELQCNLPDPTELMQPSKFKEYLDTKKRLAEEKEEISAELGVKISFNFDTQTICIISANGVATPLVSHPAEDTIVKLENYIASFTTIDEWMIYAAVDGKKGGGYKLRWDTLLASIKDAVCFSDSLVADTVGKKILVSDNTNLDVISSTLEKMERILTKKDKIGKLDVLLNKSFELVYQDVQINDSPIATLHDCHLVQKWLLLLQKRKQIETYWDELLSSHGVPSFNSLDGQEPEQICANMIPHIQRYLSWYKNEYAILMDLLHQAGFNSDRIFSLSELDSDIVTTQKILNTIKQSIPLYIKLVKSYILQSNICTQLSNNIRLLSEESRKHSALCNSLIISIQSYSFIEYQTQYSLLSKLFNKYTLEALRKESLDKIRLVAPDWAYAIENRIEIHGKSSMPDTIESAWKWKQFAGIIDDITSEPFEELQQKSVQYSKDLRKKTAELAEWRAWYYLLNRTETNLDMRQALQGWKKTVKKIGKGTGKNAPTLKRQARELMAKCQVAVPAWIMPVGKALESLNPEKNIFDVIIVDEASQSDISALAILYMAKKVIIVGDDKQVSPMAVGVDTTRMNALMEMYIKDVIPNWHLYDAKSSLYDIAGTTFQPLMLREHFRCVPDIIGYCNRLCYDFKIKPLRDSSSCTIEPSIVNYRVPDGCRDMLGKTNYQEAKIIVSLMKSCIKQHEYDGMTFGVISLLGDEQALLIQKLVLEQFTPVEIEDRKILCGNASHFQGDERDVIFLSLVDNNSSEGPLSMSSEGPGQSRRQRYNVAVSRAKNQLWVVHSLDIQKDLKPGDIRKDLLEYAENPKAYSNLASEIETNSESVFEEFVGKSLVASGYHIIQQWPVGAYRIDMVAEYNGNKIAIECDGEQYHSGEEKVRQDMERQTILERLGWRFIRIRGSEYFRNPEATMEHVRNSLTEYGIHPSDAKFGSEKTIESELLSRVKICASQFLKQWTDHNLDTDFDSTSYTKAPKSSSAATFYTKKETVISRKSTKEKVTGDSASLNFNTAKSEVPLPKVAERKISSTPNSYSSINNGKTLKTFFEDKGLTVVDKRDDFGALWVIGGQELTPIMNSLNAEGVAIHFSSRGGKSTSNQPAWYTTQKC